MKMVVDSVPRPMVVKRVRTENGTEEGSPDPKHIPRPDAMEVDQVSQQSFRENPGLPATPRPAASSVPSNLTDSMRNSRPPTPNQSMTARLASGNKPIPNSPRAALNSLDQRPPRSDAQQAMPPPTIPSQTISAQELRETAKQTRIAGDRDERNSQPPTEPRAQAGAPPTPSPRHRSPSPTSRPGTRPPSQESRASGERRSLRESGSAEKSEGRRERSEREPSRRESARNERRPRDAERERDGDRDRDGGRDRHGDRDRRERDRDRDRDRERDRGKDRERHRDGDNHKDRERDRDRDRDRDRHRRDEKDRDRDRDRKERGAGATPSTPAVDDRGLPSRPDTGRHRGDDSLGKRRRGTEDERSSRKDGHHEDRGRRSSEKDGHDRGRDSDRRRKERDDDGNKGLSVDTKVCCECLVPIPALILTFVASWATSVFQTVLDRPSHYPLRLRLPLVR
ncbi:hypothetical protein C8Q79DRAFT_398461 [Trametes meyenii]|nr:hypothetical protein C8Q79DRAFT_398461 [Trametes meyenii]